MRERESFYTYIRQPISVRSSATAGLFLLPIRPAWKCSWRIEHPPLAQFHFLWYGKDSSITNPNKEGTAVKLTRYKDGEFFETIETWDALAFLAADDQGRPRHLFDIGSGSAEIFRELVVHGIIHWPSFIPYDEDTQKCVQDVLRDAPFVDLSHEAFVSEEIRKAAWFADILEQGDECSPGKGSEAYRFEGLSFSKYALTFSGVEHSLLFVRQDGKNLIATNGAGSQKKLLTFYAVETLFGKDVRGILSKTSYWV